MILEPTDTIHTFRRELIPGFLLYGVVVESKSGENKTPGERLTRKLEVLADGVVHGEPVDFKPNFSNSLSKEAAKRLGVEYSQCRIKPYEPGELERFKRLISRS